MGRRRGASGGLTPVPRWVGACRPAAVRPLVGSWSGRARARGGRRGALVPASPPWSVPRPPVTRLFQEVFPDCPSQRDGAASCPSCLSGALLPSGAPGAAKQGSERRTSGHSAHCPPFCVPPLLLRDSDRGGGPLRESHLPEERGTMTARLSEVGTHFQNAGCSSSKWPSVYSVGSPS